MSYIRLGGVPSGIFKSRRSIRGALGVPLYATPPSLAWADESDDVTRAPSAPVRAGVQLPPGMLPVPAKGLGAVLLRTTSTTATTTVNTTPTTGTTMLRPTGTSFVTVAPAQMDPTVDTVAKALAEAAAAAKAKADAEAAAAAAEQRARTETDARLAAQAIQEAAAARARADALAAAAAEANARLNVAPVASNYTEETASGAPPPPAPPPLPGWRWYQAVNRGASRWKPPVVQPQALPPDMVPVAPTVSADPANAPGPPAPPPLPGWVWKSNGRMGRSAQFQWFPPPSPPVTPGLNLPAPVPVGDTTPSGEIKDTSGEVTLTPLNTGKTQASTAVEGMSMGMKVGVGLLVAGGLYAVFGRS